MKTLAHHLLHRQLQAFGLAARAGELKPSAVRELLKHSKLPGVISLGGGIPLLLC
jgi:hypothetical protein